MNEIRLPNGARMILSRLRSEGHRAYAVGGCVRDFLRGTTPSDVDIATSALPDAVMLLFSDCRVIATGLRHGTVTVIAEGEQYEVTTFRIDGDYKDGRHPDDVTFTNDLIADLSRRDFTVNAMAYSEGEGVLDPFDGSRDLAARTVRAVGDPQKRFTEDALRILRALRFASTLDFSIEERTAYAVRQQKELLCAVSAERIREEFVKLLLGGGAFRVLLDFAEVIAVFLPEILPSVGFDQRNAYHTYDVYTHILHTVEATPIDPVIRLAAFFHDVGKPSTFSLDEKGVGHFYGHPSESAAIADRVMRRLRFDNATREAVVATVIHHDTPISGEEKIVRRRLSAWGIDGFFRVLALKRADTLAHAPEYVQKRLDELSEIEEVARRILDSDTCLSLQSLAISGDDLISLGIPEGKEIGRLLNLCFRSVIDGETENSREALLTLIHEKK